MSKLQILKVISIFLLIEIIIGISGLYIIKYNYKALTSEESGKSEKINNNIQLKKIEFSNNIIKKEKENIDENILYIGKLGKIEKKEEIIQEKEKNKYIKTFEYTLKNEEITKQLFIKFLVENKLIDPFIFNYIKNNNIKVEDEYNNIINLLLLLKIKTKEDLKQIDFNNFLINNTKKIQNFINNKDFIGLSKVLYSFEYYNLKNISNNNYSQRGIFKDERFTYVLNKLYDKKYINNINIVSKRLNIDKKLIISSIAVEQFRMLTTDRGYAKRLIKGNKFLTNFTQFSYGLGGIKEGTYIRINKDMKKYNPYLYNNYFQKYYKQSFKLEDILEVTTLKDGASIINNNIVKKESKTVMDKEKIQKLLEDHYIGTLYVGGLVYNIIHKRKIAGIDIEKNPGVITTLYNMGNNKIPHKNPSAGGSIIKVNNEDKYYFGELGLLFYDYIKYYLKKDEIKKTTN